MKNEQVDHAQLSLVELAKSIGGNAFMLGQVRGITDAANFLRVQAGNLFALGEDDNARFLRARAIELDKKAAALRQEYDRYDARERAAYDELARRDQPA